MTRNGNVSKCFKCGKPGHFQRECWQNNTTNRGGFRGTRGNNNNYNTGRSNGRFQRGNGNNQGGRWRQSNAVEGELDKAIQSMNVYEEMPQGFYDGIPK